MDVPTKPASGRMYWWRLRGQDSWRFGYCIYLDNPDMIRMGSYNGDTLSGPVLSWDEIEVKPYDGRP